MGSGNQNLVWGNGLSRNLYEPEIAFLRCDEHATHFISHIQFLARDTIPTMDRTPVFCGLYDTEHFGHWWPEGPVWLDLVIRKRAYDQDAVRMVTGNEYLAEYSINQVVEPTMSG